MRFMNEFDLHFASQRFGGGRTPNRLALVLLVNNMRDYADGHSDGWAYWPKPARACDKAMALIESRTNRENDEQERHDITDAEMLAAARPIKAFLTRQRVDSAERELILRPLEEV